MKSRSLLAFGIALAVAGVALWWFTRASSASGVRSVSNLHSTETAVGDQGAVPKSVQVPEPVAEHTIETPTTSDAAEPLREPAAAPPPQDFESKYKLKTLDELRAAQGVVSGKLEDATQARMDELWPKFPELLAKGEYGARVTTPEAPIAYKGRGPWASKGEVFVNAEGNRVRNYMEFDISLESATAALCAEKQWLKARIASFRARQ